MTIGVIGTSYVGLVQAAGFASQGHRMICIDINASLVERLNAGEVPFYEEGLEELLQKSKDNLLFTTNYRELAEADVVFVCVGTPQLEDGTCDDSYVIAALKDIGAHAKADALVVIKSTTPPGSAAAYKEALGRADLHLAANPEFLRQGSAVKDFFHPDRVVIGVERHEDESLLKDLYQFIDAPVFVTNVTSAQLAKYASNSMLALRLSFMNEIANIAQVTGGHIKDVEEIVGSDPRIGSAFLRTGAGFGGSCFPKDVLALHQAGVKYGYEARLIAPIIEVSTGQATRFVEQLNETIVLQAPVRLAVWGLTFNKGTDDVRESPALRIIELLLGRGVSVQAYDPEGSENAKRSLGDRVTYASSKEEALQGAHALLVLTEWDEFLNADWAAVKESLAYPIVADGKNFLPHFDLQKAGFKVIGIGL